LIKQEPVRFIWAPLGLFAATIAFTWVPLGDGGSIADHVRVLATIFFIVNTYHFGVQHFGVLSIYQIRTGQKLDDDTKQRQRRLCLLLGGVFVAIGQLMHGAQVVRDSVLVGAIPTDVAWLDGAQWVMAGLAATIAVTWWRAEAARTPRSTPKLLYIAGLGAQATLAFLIDPIAFVLIWGVPHWLISIALAGQMAKNAKRRGGFYWSMSSLALVSLILAPLFYAVSTGANIEPPAAYRPMLAWLGNETFLRVMTGVAFASVYCHFVLDRAIFRFSHPDVRKITAPLVFDRQ
jgi:hypothetical protein